MAEEGRQIIFNMVKVGKTLPSGKKILNDIYLGFYYGAKIGILGLNGSGKSTLMRIIAGKDKSFDGDVHLSPGYSIGHLEQEPELDETKTVIDIVREGVQPIMDLLKEYEDVNNKFADEEILNDPDKMDKLIARQGCAAGPDRGRRCLEHRPEAEHRHGRAPLPRAGCQDQRALRW
jgi:sulfate-transporting ATPase